MDVAVTFEASLIWMSKHIYVGIFSMSKRSKGVLTMVELFCRMIKCTLMKTLNEYRSMECYQCYLYIKYLSPWLPQDIELRFTSLYYSKAYHVKLFISNIPLDMSSMLDSSYDSKYSQTINSKNSITYFE